MRYDSVDRTIRPDPFLSLPPAGEKVVPERATTKKQRMVAESNDSIVDQSRSSQTHTGKQNDRGDRRRKDINWEDPSSLSDSNDSSYGRNDSYSKHRKDNRSRSRSKDRRLKDNRSGSRSMWISDVYRGADIQAGKWKKSITD